MLPWFVEKYKPKLSIINLYAAKEILTTAEKSMFENRRFERINNVMESKSYMKHEDVPENKQMFVYGFKQSKQLKLVIIFQSNVSPMK